jgi:hypothetical protein
MKTGENRVLEVESGGSFGHEGQVGRMNQKIKRPLG